MNDTITPYIHKKVLIVDVHTPCQFVARAMRDKAVGCVVVSDGTEHLVGIVTDRDLATNLVAENFSPNIAVGEVMTVDLQVAYENSGLDEVLNLMEFNGIRRLPVLSTKKRQRIIGIISLDDLILAHALPIERVGQILAQQAIDDSFVSDVSHSRSEARKEQKYNTFRKRMANGARIDPVLAEIIFKELFYEIVQRLPLNGATQFISQLPNILQEELLSAPVGPNRRITARDVVHNLLARTDLKESKIREHIQDLWLTLGRITSDGEVDDTLAQLPNDFVILLTGLDKSFSGFAS